MPKFLAITSRGLIEPLAAELKDLQFKHVAAKPDGVLVECSWAEVQRLHQRTRLATRVLLPVADFLAYNEDDLYFGALRKHDFTQYIDVDQTFRIEAKVREHPKLRDQRFVAMKVKDAIADQFRNKFGKRPDVGDEETAALRIVVRVVGPNKVSMAVDLTGSTLSTRGYRREAGVAPLRENVAAGLVMLSNWQPGQMMVDPFCGSGTILIEAALIAAGRAPRTVKHRSAFERLKNYEKAPLASFEPAAEPATPMFYGYDVDGGVIEVAKRNARDAGVAKWIHFEKREMKSATAPAPQGVLITNPPYGERLEDTEKAKQLLSDFSSVLKNQFKGWDAWILSGNKEAITGLRLKAARRIPIWNGPIECRFLHYKMY
jgi:putative N6-adenine-specific DNA methylase